MTNILLLLLVIAAYICGCAENPAGAGDDVRTMREIIIYSQDFSTAFDTTGWVGINEMNWIDASRYGRGGKCLEVGGGCFQPVAQYKLAAGTGFFTIRMQAACPDSGQTVSVEIGLNGNSPADTTGLVSTVNAGGWQECTAGKYLLIPEGHYPILNIVAGGFIPARLLLSSIVITWRAAE